MTIQRRYVPDDEALEQVVEILYRLLVAPKDGGAAEMAPPAADSTCISEDEE